MANTENIEAKLCAYVDGELDPAGRAEIEVHLASNPQHRQLMSELMSQRDMLAGLPRERAPEDLFEAMTNQLERSVLLDGDAAQAGAIGGAERPHIAGQINRWPQVFAAAAVLMLALGLAAVIYFVLPNQNEPDARVATVSGTGAAAPALRAAESQPTALARADADRIESKAGPMKAEADTGAAAAPTAVAAVPPPATPTLQNDIFSKSGPRADANAKMSNVFADAQQFNEKLKSAPGVPDKSMLVVVNANDPSATNQQLRDYFSNNGIKWEPAAEPMPSPLELRQSQTVYRSRLNQTQMNLKGGPPSDTYAGTFGGSGGGGGAGGFGATSGRDMKKPAEPAPNAAAATPAPPAPSEPPGPVDSTDVNQQQQVAQAEPNRATMKEDTIVLKDKDVAGAKQSTADAAAAAPAAPSGPPGAATADAAKRQLDDSRNNISGGAGVNAPPINGKSAAPAAGSAGAIAQSKTAVSDQSVTDEIAHRRAPAEEGLMKQQAAAPPAPATTPPRPPPPVAGAEQQQRQLEQIPQQPGQQQQQQKRGEFSTNMEGGAFVQSQAQSQNQQAPAQLQSQGQPQAQQAPPQQQQVFIARGVTRKQLMEINSTIALGNRISNYSRSGDTITPAPATATPPLPALDGQLSLESPVGAASQSAVDAINATRAPTTTPARESEKANEVARAAKAAPATRPVVSIINGARGGAGGAPAATSPATTAPTGSSTFYDTNARSGGVPATLTGAGALAHPTTTAATATTSTADERLDVVILVQPDTDGVLQWQEVLPNAAAPNAAAIDDANSATPTTPAPATTTTTTSPASTSAPATTPVAQ